MSLTVFGKVTLLEAIVPPNPPEAEGPPEGTPPDPLQDVVDVYRTKMPPKEEEKRRGRRSTREGEGEGGDEAKTWTHLHVTLDEPHTGEVSVLCPEIEASGLVLDGRARVIFSSQ